MLATWVNTLCITFHVKIRLMFQLQSLGKISAWSQIFTMQTFFDSVLLVLWENLTVKSYKKNHLPYRFIRTPCSKNCPVVSCTFDTTRMLLLSEFWFQPVLLGEMQKESDCFTHKPSLCYVKYVHVTSSSSSAVSISNPTRTCSYVPTTTSMNETLDEDAEIVAGIAERRREPDQEGKSTACFCHEV